MISSLQGVRIVFFTLWDFFLYHFRLPLMTFLQQQGAEVIAIAPPGPFGRRFEQYGISFIPLNLDRRTFHPGKAWGTIRTLRGILHKYRPHLLQTFAHRPNAYGAWAVSGQDVVHVATVTGLGSLYVHHDVKTRLRRALMEWALRRGFQNSAAVIFQNPDDRDEFLRRQLVLPQQAHLIPGSGVDVDRFSPERFSAEDRQALRRQWGLDARKPVVMMVSRFIRDKGILEFLQMAQRLQGQAHFVLIGAPDPGNPMPLWMETVEQEAQQGGVLLPGFQEDIPSWLAIADIFVLPSYREGMPKTLLEAMAMGLPIVTTNVPGCRHAVRDGWNGVLVPPRDVEALTAAVQHLLKEPELRILMGKRSRHLAVNTFAQTIINQQYYELYRRILKR